MEELAIKIAETLDISVQAAIDMYPVIRSQFIWYQAINNINIWAFCLGFISMVVVGVSGMIRQDTDKYDWHTEEINEEWVDINKIFKVSLSAFALAVIISVTTDMIIPFLAPDVMLIKNFLG